MSFWVIVEKEAEEDLKEAMRWIMQASPEKAALWYFDATQGNSCTGAGRLSGKQDDR